MRRIKEIPYWILAIVLTLLSPLMRPLHKRQMWPFNEDGPAHRRKS